MAGADTRRGGVLRRFPSAARTIAGLLALVVSVCPVLASEAGAAGGCPTLRVGDHGSCVLAYERALAAAFPGQGVSTDGKFGRTTAEVTKRFEQTVLFRAAPTGVADPAVQDALARLPEPTPHREVILGASNTVTVRGLGLEDSLRLHGVQGVVVSAVRGTTTTVGDRNALVRLQRLETKGRFERIQIYTGINDVRLHERMPVNDAAGSEALVEVFLGYIRRFLDYADGRPVVWGTVVRLGDPRTDLFNEALRRARLEYPNLSLVDVAGHPREHPEWFVSDGIHLTKEGALDRMRCIVSVTTRVVWSGLMACPVGRSGHTPNPRVR